MAYKYRKVFSLICMVLLLFTSVLQAVPTYAEQESNTHSGTWAMKVDLTGVNWKAAGTGVSVDANTDYLVKFWIKGSGLVQVAVKSNDWSNVIVSSSIFLIINCSGIKFSFVMNNVPNHHSFHLSTA